MLYTLFHSNIERAAVKWQHYFPVYERFFKDFVNKSVVLFEIGVQNGGSLQMWKRYLGPFLTVVGIDIDPLCSQHEDDQCKVRIGDQADVKFLASVIKEFGCPDIVIDDGSHRMSDMKTSFDFLYPLLNNNGVYIVEDTHTCYWPSYGGALGSPETFIEKAKGLVDELNAYHIPSVESVSDFTRNTFSVNFFDSMVVFEKRRFKPYLCATGAAFVPG